MGDPSKFDVVAMLRVKELGDKIDRLAEVIERLDKHLIDESCSCDQSIVEVELDAGPDESGQAKTLAEVIQLAVAYLYASDKRCSLMRFGDKWSHFSDRGDVVGAWQTIEDAAAATDCHGSCDRGVFPSVTS